MKSVVYGVIFTCFMGPQWLSGQESGYFRSPVDAPTRLSGSFGEPRTRHFHAGIDFKPYHGYMRDTIFAVAEGYVSRINVRPDGYGNALYIDHPNGYTSVYAHLAKFSEEIKRYTETIQYEKEVYAIEHYPDKGELQVKKGTPIGIMGNTGRSSGVHLHFEIRETDSEVPVNPAIYQIKPEDTKYPTIRGIMVYNVLPDGEIWQKEYHRATYVSPGKYKINDSTIRSGSLLVGVGIHAFDTMNGAGNHNGIYGLSSKVNGEERFGFSLDKIGFDVSKYIHAHMDYEEKMDNRYVTKCFKEQLNPLPIYQTDKNNGLIHLFESQPTEVTIAVRDFEGNQSEVTFEIVRDNSLTPFGRDEDSTFVRVKPADSVSFQLGDISLDIRPGTFVQPVSLYLKDCSPQDIDLSQDSDFAVFRSIKLGASFEYPEGMKDKYIFTSTDRRGKRIHQGGQWENDSTLVTYVGSFDQYKVVRDLEPPDINISSMAKTSRPRLEFILKDNFEPSRRDDEIEYQVLVDNRWRLCSHDIKTNKISCDFSTLEKGREYELVIEAVDAQQNTSIVTRTFSL